MHQSIKMGNTVEFLNFLLGIHPKHKYLQIHIKWEEYCLLAFLDMNKLIFLLYKVKSIT